LDLTRKRSQVQPCRAHHSPVEQGFCRSSRTADALEQVAAQAPSAEEHFPV
jgi:hypothetical protein